MRNIITYVLITLSLYSYGQCDLYALGGDYKHPNPKSKTEIISVFISTDLNDHEIVVFDFFGMDDTVLVESRLVDGKIVNHYRIEPSSYESNSYPIKSIQWYDDCSCIMKIGKNKDKVKWVEFHDGKVCIIHKHGLFRKCVISFKKYGN